MTPQTLSTAQLEAALRAMDARLRAKKLEIDSLNTLRDNLPLMAARLFRGEGTAAESDSLETVTDATHNYLTAKINWALMDLEQMELQRRMVVAQQSMVQPAGGVLPTNRRPQG